MTSPQTVPLVALAVKNSSGYAEALVQSVERCKGTFRFSRQTSLKALASRPEDFDLLVAGLDFPGLARMLKTGAIPVPIILLAKPECEEEAVSLLERGQVADYLLTRPDHLQRLPFVLRASHKHQERKRIADAADQMMVLQEAVYQIARASEQAEVLEDLLPRIHEIVGRVMAAENFYIALYDAGRDVLSYPYFVDEQEQLTDTSEPAGDGLTEYVIRSGRSMLCTREEQERMSRSGDIIPAGPLSAVWLGVPLIVDKTAIGAMVVQHYRNPAAYGEPEQRMLEFVSSQVAMVIHRKQIYAALRASEERYRSVFENANVGLARVTPAGEVLLANPALLKMLGYSSLGELQTRNVNVDGYAEGYSRREFLDHMLNEGQVRGFESAWKKADNSILYVRDNSRLVRDEAGQPLYYESVVEDITDRHRAESALHEKIIALQSLAEIDREILAAENAQAILELVCDRIARLLHAPKAAIMTTDAVPAGEEGQVKWEPGQIITATYGFEHIDQLEQDLKQAVGRGMLQHWRALAIPDQSLHHARYMPEFSEREHIQSLVIEPFSTTSGLRGALAVLDTRPRSWSQDETQLVHLLAGQAALALEKVRLLNDARRRASEFAGLYQVAGELTARRDIGSLLSLIVSKASGLYKVSNAFIYLYDEKRRELVLSVASSEQIYKVGTVLSLGEGMAGRVAQNREPMIVQSYSSWPDRSAAYDDRTILAVLEVPMLYSGNLIGILGIETNDPTRPFDEQDQRSLSLLAEQAASAIYNARLFSQIEDRNRELDRLSRASTTLLAGVSSDIPSLCHSIAELLVSEFSYSNCSIWLTADDGLTLTRGAIAGPFTDEQKNSLLTTKGPGVIAKAIRSRTTINLGDVSLSQDYIAGSENTRSELVVPLRSGDRIVGAIDLQSQDLNAYSPDDVRLIEMIATRAALMLEHIRLYQQTERRLQQLTVLSNIDAAIASSLDLQVTLNILVSQISMHLHADAVDVLLYNPHLQQLEYATGRGFRGPNIRRVSLLLGEDQAGQAALERAVVSVVKLGSPQVILSHPERIAGEDFVSMYAVPLVAKGQVKGVLELFFRRMVEPEDDWLHFLEILARQAAVAVEDASLLNDMQRSFSELADAYDASIEGWARLLEMRQHEPESASHDLASLTIQLCRRMGIREAELPHVYRGVLLHDIGKLAIPDIILFKEGPLMEEEWQVVRRHPVYAYDLLQSISYLRPALNIPYCHHERWDGSGYPRGLKGNEIPLEARIFSAVNAWTVLQQDRPFRRAWERERATARLRQHAGSEFDPQVVEEFLDMLAELEIKH